MLQCCGEILPDRGSRAALQHGAFNQICMKLRGNTQHKKSQNFFFSPCTHYKCRWEASGIHIESQEKITMDFRVILLDSSFQRVSLPLLSDDISIFGHFLLSFQRNSSVIPNGNIPSENPVQDFTLKEKGKKTLRPFSLTEFYQLQCQ